GGPYRQRCGVAPFVNFSMAIGEVEAARTAMIVGRRILPDGVRKLPVHRHGEGRVVDAVWVLVNHDPDVGRRRNRYVRSLLENPPRRRAKMFCWICSERLAHRNAPHPRVTLPAETSAQVGWAFVNPYVF